MEAISKGEGVHLVVVAVNKALEEINPKSFLTYAETDKMWKLVAAHLGVSVFEARMWARELDQKGVFEPHKNPFLI